MPRPLKIAFVSTMEGAPWGGSEELWNQTALRLLAEGDKVCVSLIDWGERPAPVRAVMEAGGKIMFRALKKATAGRLIDKFWKVVSPGPLRRECMTWLRNEAPDLLVISQGMPWEGLHWMEACSSLGVPYCPLVHANSEVWWPNDDNLELIRSGFGSARCVFFVSHENKRLAELQCGVRLPHGEVVINPWKVDAASAVPWLDDDGVTQIACVGRVDPQAKGQDLLLQVMAMPKWRARALRLNIYGGGPSFRSVQALAEMLELNNVNFAGHVSDVAEIWSANHALVLPSRYEGLPLVIVEAMLCGRPVVTTNVAGNAEFLTEGASGFIAAAPTVGLLDEALERAWSRRSDWREMGAKGREDLLGLLPKDPIHKFVTRLRCLARPDADAR